METVIIALSTSVIFNGIWTAILGYWVQHRFNVELETHKAKLDRETAERNFRFSQVFNKTADTIATVYEKLLALLDAAEDYTELMKDSKTDELEQIKKMRAASDGFYDYFHPRKIYIPRPTADKILDLSHAVTLLVSRHARAEILINFKPRTPEGTKVIEQMNKDISELKKTVPILLRGLEDDFQKIFGLTIEENKG